MDTNANAVHRETWNKGRIVGQKAPFKLKDIWALRVRFQMESRVREFALFNLGIDSKLRGCDLVSLKVRDICHGDQVVSRAVVMQHKTQRPVFYDFCKDRSGEHPRRVLHAFAGTLVTDDYAAYHALHRRGVTAAFSLGSCVSSLRALDKEEQQVEFYAI